MTGMWIKPAGFDFQWQFIFQNYHYQLFLKVPFIPQKLTLIQVHFLFMELTNETKGPCVPPFVHHH